MVDCGECDCGKPYVHAGEVKLVDGMYRSIVEIRYCATCRIVWIGNNNTWQRIDDSFIEWK